MLIYLNGEYVTQNEARVSVFDRGYLYGDGVFEGVRAYNGRVFKLQEHVQRLYQSAGAILLEIPMAPEEMSEAIVETCRRNGIHDGYIRVVVSRGSGDLGLNPETCGDPTVVIIADTIQLYPTELYEKGMRIMSVPTRRNHHEALNPRIKSLNYLNNIMAKIEGNLAGYNEVIMLSQDGYVVECTGDNIFIVTEDTIVTPPSFVGIVKGITRGVVIDTAGAYDIPVREELFTRYDVHSADECFLTGTACEVIPVIECDGRTIGSGIPGPITRQMISEFNYLVRSTGTPIARPRVADVGGEGG